MVVVFIDICSLQDMRYPFSARFYCGNAFDFEWATRNLNWDVYDLVSCQFALHYAFQNKATIESAFRIIAWALGSNGGRFIATIPNAAVIEQHLSYNPIWKTDQFTIETLSSDAYYFTMADAVNRVPEYFVRPAALIEHASNFGLEVVSVRSFREVYQQSKELAKRLRITEREALAATQDNLYLAIVLQPKNKKVLV